MSRGGPRAWWHEPALLVALLCAVAAVHATGVDGDFVVDARALVLENPRLREATLDNVVFLATHDYWQPMATDGLYRPVTTLSFLVDHAVLGDGDRPRGYHVTNLVLHLACVALVWALVRRLGGRAWPALVAAAIVGLHPIVTEAVTNVVGRADLLATLGMLVALLCHARGPARGGWPWTLGVVAGAVVAFGSKESGLVLPVVLVAHDVLLCRRLRRRGDWIVVAVVLAAYAVARTWVAWTGLPPEPVDVLDNPIAHLGFVDGRLTALTALARAGWLLLWPAALSADYSYRAVPPVAWPPTAAQAAELVAVVAIAIAAAAWAWRARRTQPLRVFWLVFSAAAVAPTANLLVPIGTILAERTLYLPLIGVAALAAGLADARVPSSGRRVATAVVAVLLVAGAWRTVVRNGDWVDELHLWASALQVVPQSAKAHAGYAAARFAADPRHADIDVVIAEAERAVAILPTYTSALVNLGGYRVVKGDQVAARDPAAAARWWASAVEVLERARAQEDAATARFAAAVADRPDRPERTTPLLDNNLALAYARAGRLADALPLYARRAREAPADADRRADVAEILTALGRWDEAAVALLSAIALAPERRDLVARLAEGYQRFDADGRAVVRDAGGSMHIDLATPTVHRQRCRALETVAAAYQTTGAATAAARTRAAWTTECAR